MNCIIDTEINCSCVMAMAIHGQQAVHCCMFFKFNHKLIYQGDNLPCLIVTPGIACPDKFKAEGHPLAFLYGDCKGGTMTKPDACDGVVQFKKRNGQF